MGITPKGIEKRIKDMIEGAYDFEEGEKELKAAQTRAKYEAMGEKDLEKRTEASGEADARRRAES
mgnify:CR=1 FL=1